MIIIRNCKQLKYVFKHSSWKPQFSMINRIHNSSPECSQPLHVPVMAKEVVDTFNLKPGQVVLDMTFGAGGHTKELLQTAPNLKIVALDRDPVSYQCACELAEKYPGQIIPLLGRFSELPTLLTKLNIRQNTFDAILFDFGCSSMQFDNAERGFSISKDGPLDMRMDGTRFPDQPTAADVVAQASESDLLKILKIYGEEKQYKKIARGIIEARYRFTRIKTTKQLCDLVDTMCSSEERVDKLGRPTHVATKTFQALRIFVNNEVNEINYGMLLASKYLKVGGICVAISFHSIEDTIVKRHMQGNIVDNAVNPLPLQYCSFSLSFDEKQVAPFLQSNWDIITKHVVAPNVKEVHMNPRSRSAKLRAAVRVM